MARPNFIFCEKYVISSLVKKKEDKVRNLKWILGKIKTLYYNTNEMKKDIEVEEYVSFILERV